MSKILIRALIYFFERDIGDAFYELNNILFTLIEKPAVQKLQWVFYFNQT